MPDIVSPYTYDLTTPTGEVRLYIPDCTPGAWLFSDAEIGVFLRREGGQVECAAAAALGVVATSTARTEQYIKTNAIELDGVKPAEFLLKRAKALREQVAEPSPLVEAEEDAWEFLGGCGQ